MQIKIYQINSDRDRKRVKFFGYETTQKYGGVNPSIYDLVYEGITHKTDLEGVFQAFNFESPECFKGHSLSVSDVVTVIHDGTERCEPGTYFCDSCGWKKIDFDDSKCGIFEREDRQISVIVVEPGKKPYVKDISGTLGSMQSIVGGYIEALYPTRDPIAIVCNEEGKINGLPSNRRIIDENGYVIDVIMGTFFICGIGDEDFDSIPGYMERKYLDLFDGNDVYLGCKNTRKIAF